jgi:excisionase family DNA binding protein
LRNLRENLLGGTANLSGEAGVPVEALSVHEAAARAGVSRTFIYERISSGELPSIKLGKRRLVRVKALHRWLESHETRAS